MKDANRTAKDDGTAKTEGSGTQPASFRTVAAHATGEITEKKSRFIADVFPVGDEAAAQAHIAAIVKQHHDARHHCHAFVLGTRGDLMRSSDNGEPSGTAGRPILDVITGAGLTGTLIVVTRYFGGVLLGTGGLTRAYMQAAQEGLKQAEIETHIFGNPLTVRIAYTMTGSVEHYLRRHSIDPGTPVYETDVRYGLFLPAQDVPVIINDLTNICSGNIDIAVGDACFRRASLLTA